MRRLRPHDQLIHVNMPGGQITNARYLFRYARNVLALLACVGFGKVIN